MQIEKASFELHNLEKALQFDDTDSRLLKEYREAGSVSARLLPTFNASATTSRAARITPNCFPRWLPGCIRRAIDLCAEVVADLDAGHAKITSKDAEAFYRTLEYPAAA